MPHPAPKARPGPTGAGGHRAAIGQHRSPLPHGSRSRGASGETDLTTCIEGVGMNRHSARLMRVAGGALAATVIAPWLGGVAFAANQPLVSGDPRATAVAGNIHDDPEHAGTICEQLGFPNDTEVGADNAAGYNADDIQFDSDGTYLDAVSVPAGEVVDVVVVKAGDCYNRYDAPVFVTLPVNDMHGPLVGNAENVPTISHWAACIGDAPEEPTPPSGTVTGDCDNATVDVAAGSEDTTFVIDHDGTTQQDAVSAQNGDHVVVPWSGDSTVSVSVLGGEAALDSATRDSATCDKVESVTDPAVAFANACKTGISVTLTNMKVDDTTTDDVTFTVVSPSGKSKHVTVRADQIVKLNYPVKEDTTATVTVSAPGLSATSHSYKKNCTKVLGEKVVKTPKPPAVQGEQAQLPFTGMPAGMATIIAGLMLAVGGGLTVLGRRRSAGSAS